MPYASLDHIAHLLKLTPRMVNKHVKDNGMPRISRGEYDMVLSVHWYIDFLHAQIQAARRGDETEQQARSRLIKASANLKELELAREQGRLITQDTVKILWERIVIAFKNRMLIIPTKLPQRLVACTQITEVKQLLEQEIHEALNELSSTDIDTAPRPGATRPVDDETGKSSAKADGKRVGRQKPDTQPRVKR